MKQSQMYIPTLKEVPNDAEIMSHKLLLKAGYINQTASGIYTYLPLANKVLLNIENIVREELDKISANEIRMPFLQPKELWSTSGRWDEYGDELFRVRDRHNREFALAPTHEEIATDLIKNYVKSYKTLPLNLYQIQTKMRDERRPRFGLMRGREFIMMDGYAFCDTEENLKEIYDKYYVAYQNIFNRLGINYKIVGADNGTMGGKYSHEFMAISDVGEDFIAYEENSEIAFNLEIAPVFNEYSESKDEELSEEKIKTEEITKIEDVAKKLQVDKSKCLKAVCYNIDSKLVIAFVLGNRNVCELKVLKALGGKEIAKAQDKLLYDNNIIPGFIGPQGLDVEMIFDREIKYEKNLVVGANEKDYHIKNYNNLKTMNFSDIREVQVGDIIRPNGDEVKITKGIEMGHIFSLGENYTESIGVKYLTREQKQKVPTMGSFGIGISRVLSTIVEQNSDEFGIVLPEIVSPYDIHIIALDYEKQEKDINNILKELDQNNIKYLIDDRDQRPGFKFKDADLIGLPIQITIGRGFDNGVIEIKKRSEIDSKKEIKVENLIQEIKDIK